MKELDVENRIKKAVDNFESGYNCAQAVFLAYADLFNLNKELAATMSVSFGGGIGRMREVCGAVSGMAMIAGFHSPVTEPTNIDQRTLNYSTVQRMADAFKAEYETIICRELLKKKETKTDTNPQPSKRTQEYYSKRPCAKFVATAARIAGEMLKKESGI
ncbi:MAG: C-GCAxxG-C-C family protein [Tannerellaceae bacterium]|nr:C-GCAxxG-C-C family protein [Tannerellaceae bacterium]